MGLLATESTFIISTNQLLNSRALETAAIQHSITTANVIWPALRYLASLSVRVPEWQNIALGGIIHWALPRALFLPRALICHSHAHIKRLRPSCVLLGVETFEQLSD